MAAVTVVVDTSPSAANAVPASAAAVSSRQNRERPANDGEISRCLLFTHLSHTTFLNHQTIVFTLSVFNNSPVFWGESGKNLHGMGGSKYRLNAQRRLEAPIVLCFISFMCLGDNDKCQHRNEKNIIP